MATEDLRLTDVQRRILAALCRPCLGESRFAPPATNQEIADQLFLSVDAIKAHLRVLYRKFGIDPLPHNQKRARLVELAMEGGVVSEGDLEEIESPAPTDLPAGTVVASPSTLPADAAETATPAPPSVPRVRRSRRLIALGVGVGVGAVAVTAAILAPGGDSKPTKADALSQIGQSCRIADKGAGDLPASGAPLPAATLNAIQSVRARLDTLGTPSGDHRALDQFGAGLDQAAEYVSEVAEGVAAADPAGARIVFAKLTLAAGKIEAGALGYGLDPACSSIGDRVGLTQPQGP